MDPEAAAPRRGWLPSNMAKPAPADAMDDDHGSRAVAGSLALGAALITLGAIVLVLPWPLQRPIWIKAEIVFSAWWVVWVVVLTAMLYRGVSLRRRPTYASDRSDVDASWWTHLDSADFGFFGGEGWMLIAAFVLAGVLLSIAWLVVEVIAPILVPVGYAVVWWMLARVLRSSARCKGSVMKSLAQGILWASAYSLPLAIGVALLRVVI